VKVLREGFGGLAGDGDAADDDPPEEEELLPPPKVPSFTKDLRSLLESFLVALPPPLPKTAFRVELDDEAKTNGCFVFRDEEEYEEEKKLKLPVEEADLLRDSSLWSRISATWSVLSMICSGVYPASNSICVLVRTERTILRRAALPPFDDDEPEEDRSIADDETILLDAVIFRNCSYSSRSQV